jgi:predicted nucleic acid-binding protein
MRVVDTSAWLEWLSGSSLGRKIEAALPEMADWIVPTIVQYELSRHVTRLASEEAAEQAIGYSMRCVVLPVDTRIAVRAAEFARGHTLAMADAIIYASAIETGSDLLTCDSHFSPLPSVVYFPKSGR